MLFRSESHGQRSLAGYSPWGCKESDTIERLHFSFSLQGYNIASLTSIHIYCYPLQFQPPNCRLNNLSRETNVITSVIPPSSPPYVLVTQCVRLFVTPWTVACQAPLSMGLSDKNTGVGCHSRLQGIFLTQGSNLGLLDCG